jgi:hypothetical protein
MNALHSVQFTRKCAPSFECHGDGASGKDVALVAAPHVASYGIAT